MENSSLSSGAVFTMVAEIHINGIANNEIEIKRFNML